MKSNTSVRAIERAVEYLGRSIGDREDATGVVIVDRNPGAEVEPGLRDKVQLVEWKPADGASRLGGKISNIVT